jgi:chromosome segregation protein
MRLKQIKLAGFKSFVDPTKVQFREQMTAIVGPNGCGKSNIIDAVRWVLGESSAKNLRGDAMTDVVFNGASSRKPVSQASVELLFENTAGRLQGSMADRNEVAIRRLVNRDTTSSYFLNGVKCRRRDITDIFLGTGLGPRSYAIIEQGTISRLIESKPQELRVFIEEAAGISKYKIRRHDTEVRMRHTRENLERLSDIQTELGQQIERLDEQCQSAKRFKKLKASERQYKAELAALRWQQFDQKNSLSQQKIQELQQDIEQLVLQQNHQTSMVYQAKQQIETSSDTLSQLQQQKLQLGADLARVEQGLKHAKQQKTELSQLQAQCELTLEKTKKAIECEQQALLPLQTLLDKYDPELAVVEQQIDQLGQQLEQAMAQQRSWQTIWDAHNQASAKLQEQSAQIDNQLTTQRGLLQRSQQRRQLVQDELTTLASPDAELNPAQLGQQLATRLHQLNALNAEQQMLIDTHDKTQQQLNALNQQVASREGLQQAQQVNLEQLTIRQNEQQDWQIAQSNWLTERGIAATTLFYQQCQVEPGWQQVAEVVLSAWLQAELVEQLPTVLDLDTAFMVQQAKGEQGYQSRQAITVVKGTLAEKVQSNNLLLPQLNSVYVVEDLSQAYAMLPKLALHESVICQDTTWLGHGFIRKGSPQASNEYLQRAQNITKLTQQIEQAISWLEQTKSQSSVLEQQLGAGTDKRRLLKLDIEQKQNQCQSLAQTKALAEQKIAQRAQQSHKLAAECAELNAQITQEQGLYKQTLEQQSLLQQGQATDTSSDKLIEKREQLSQTLQTNQGQIKRCHEQKHQLILAIEQGKRQQGQHQQALKSLSDDEAQFTTALALHQQKLAQNIAPIAQDEQKQQQWLAQMLALDDKLTSLNQGQANAQQSIEQIEKQKQQVRQKIDQVNQQINKHQLESENFRLRAETNIEQLTNMQRNVKDVLATLPKSAKEGVWQANIVRLANDISTLGPINLAAIDEYESQFQRKAYLDQQSEDLNQALNTLGSAIGKIDKESRQKFKVTFEQINEGFKALFPKVFGGGSAYLALTGDDLLETGVSIMARPPGKKNSTIHLLSGGEKALTALSLVFAIFRLNPAPFCLLDEVDAPLDDANVVRFCNLVREMSQTVQFIYISHNKIAMEMAAQLTGVTMFEPGVSRIVSVDIDEALAMADVS